MRFGKFDTFIFDLDGTIWDVVRLIPGASRTIKKLRASGKTILIISNHTMYGRKEIARRLRKMGLKIKYQDIINSSYAIGMWLKERRVKKVFAFGRGLVGDLKEQGIKTTGKLPVKYVV